MEVRYNNYLTPISMTRTVEGYEADIRFVNGLNSYYITVVARDGITTEQYNVNVVHTPDTVSELKDLKINGLSVANFDPAVNKYLVELAESSPVTVEAVSDQKVRIRIGDAYSMEDSGADTLTTDQLKDGSNDVYIVTVADDGIVRNAYQVELLVPYAQNVELFTFDIDGSDVIPSFDADGAASVFVSRDTAEVRIVTKDTGASIKAVSGSDVTEGTGSVTHTVQLNGRTAELTVTVIARDGITVKTYTVTLTKVLDPNDSSRDIPVEVLTATAGDWQTGYEDSEGPANLVLDNNPSTLWHTNWYGTSRENHWIQFELSEDYVVDGLRYLPRSGGSSNGTITEYEILVSSDGIDFESVTSGSWANNTSWKIAEFGGRQVKFVRLRAVNAISDSTYVFASAAEIRLTGEKAHEHRYEAVVTAPTCTERGYTTYTCACGDSYVADYVDALGHTEAEAVIENNVDPTCTTDGSYDSVVYCSVCGTELRRTTESVPALGHDWMEDGSCSRCDEVKTPIVNPFVDVSESEYYYDAIMWAVEEQITSGTTDTTFSPNDTLLRGHFVTFLWRAAGEPEPTIENPFVDVATSAYYYKAVLWAYEMGITDGITDTTFGPTMTTTRAQAVVFIWRYKDCPQPTAASSFVDVPSGLWSTDAIAWAVSEGITNGYTQTIFGHNLICSRAQGITFLYRTFR